MVSSDSFGRIEGSAASPAGERLFATVSQPDKDGRRTVSFVVAGKYSHSLNLPAEGVAMLKELFQEISE